MIDTSKMCFVFGSNEGGIHGAGAARFARDKRNAVMGVGNGPTGSCYAIPTKGVMRLPRIGYVVGDTLSLEKIKLYVDQFLAYAEAVKVVSPDCQFQVTAIGCGLAGLKDEDICPMFNDAPINCWFDEKWARHFRPGFRHYWGTF